MCKAQEMQGRTNHGEAAEAAFWCFAGIVAIAAGAAVYHFLTWAIRVI